MVNVVMVTGADGYLGSRLVRRFCAEGARVLATVRANSDQELTAKRLRMEQLVGQVVEVFPVDVCSSDPFVALEAHQNDIDAIVHSAGVIRFDVDEARARQVNVEGATKTAAFARTCPRLQAFGLLSTVYATGLQNGEIAEEPPPPVGQFANFYEWSKAEAEQALVDHFGDLPLRILRVATVIADDAAGGVGQYNAFHQTLKLCFYGLTSVIPGDIDVPLYLVPADFVVDSVVRAMTNPRASGVLHVSHGADRAVTIQQLLDVAFAEFARDDHFRRRRILAPLLADRETFDLLRDGLTNTGGAMVTQALDSMASFAPQLYVDKRLHNERMVEVRGEPIDIDVLALVRATCRHLVQTRWGRQVPVATS